MGDTLSKPVTEKHTSTFETSMLRVGCCGMQGWRKNMEDAHIAQLNLGGQKNRAIFGVFDGHNGHMIAKHCGNNIVDVLVSQKEFASGDYSAAYTKTFLDIDQTLYHTPEYRNEGGCTACSVLLANNKIYCANAGDSRAVLFRRGEAIALSDDHKPTLEKELDRITKAGGSVSGGRVNGILSLSRAIGDFDFKENTAVPWEDQVISAKPDVRAVDQSPDDGFIVIACDGVWDVLSNEACCQFIQQQISETNDIGITCERVLDKCLAPAAPGIGCDNMTIIIVQFKAAFFGR